MYNNYASVRTYDGKDPYFYLNNVGAFQDSANSYIGEDLQAMALEDPEVMEKYSRAVLRAGNTAGDQPFFESDRGFVDTSKRSELLNLAVYGQKSAVEPYRDTMIQDPDPVQPSKLEQWNYYKRLDDIHVQRELSYGDAAIAPIDDVPFARNINNYIYHHMLPGPIALGEQFESVITGIGKKTNYLRKLQAFVDGPTPRDVSKTKQSVSFKLPAKNNANAGSKVELNGYEYQFTPSSFNKGSKKYKMQEHDMDFNNSELNMKINENNKVNHNTNRKVGHTEYIDQNGYEYIPKSNAKFSRSNNPMQDITISNPIDEHERSGNTFYGNTHNLTKTKNVYMDVPQDNYTMESQGRTMYRRRHGNAQSEDLHQLDNYEQLHTPTNNYMRQTGNRLGISQEIKDDMLMYNDTSSKVKRSYKSTNYESDYKSSNEYINNGRLLG